jgi:hypothetical protein
VTAHRSTLPPKHRASTTGLPNGSSGLPQSVGNFSSWRLADGSRHCGANAGCGDQGRITIRKARTKDPNDLDKPYLKKNPRIHDLRHSAASLWHSQGVPLITLSAQLGHEDVAVTAKVYAHLVDGAGKAAADVMAGLFERQGVGAGRSGLKLIAWRTCSRRTMTSTRPARTGTSAASVWITPSLAASSTRRGGAGLLAGSATVQPIRRTCKMSSPARDAKVTADAKWPEATGRRVEPRLSRILSGLGLTLNP